MRLTLTKKEHLRDRQRFTNLQKNCLQIVRQFYNNIPQGKIMTTLNILSSTVYVITTSEDLKNQEKSLCARDKTKNHWIVVFRPSDSTALKNRHDSVITEITA